MRYTPDYLLKDPNEVKRLIREYPWATIVSSTAKGLVASHYPIVLEESTSGTDGAGDDSISIVSHVGRPDERAHELGEHEVLVIVQGPHGYVSPGWYGDGSYVPTWNHITAHLYGTPEILGDDENFGVLADLVDYFEQRLPDPVSIRPHEEAARRVATGTVGIRIRITRFDARAKMSQGKSPEVVRNIVGALETDGPYASQALADEMRRIHD